MKNPMKQTISTEKTMKQKTTITTQINKTRITIALLLVSFLLINLSSALTINSITAPSLQPGEEGTITIEIENNLEEDAKDVSFILNFQNLPFTPVGSSEESVDEIEEDDEEDFIFTIKAANDILPGDYQIPYTFSFKIDNQHQTRQGAIGVTVKADSELTFSLSTEKPVLNQQDKITLKIVNKGFADAKFLAVKLIPDQTGYTLLSEDEVYIGTVDSDDFETAAFDLIYKSPKPIFSAIVEYRDFENNKKIESVNLPITVYTNEQALQLGLIKKNNTPLYIAIVVAIILLWVLYRNVRKAIRKSRRERSDSQR